MRFGLTALATLAPLACAGSPRHAGRPRPVAASRAPRAPVVTPACSAALSWRASARSQLTQGKPDRARRELARADALCPQDAPSSRDTALEALLELGRDADALLAPRSLLRRGRSS